MRVGFLGQHQKQTDQCNANDEDEPVPDIKPEEGNPLRACNRVDNAAIVRIHLRTVAREIVAFGTSVQPERDYSDERDNPKDPIFHVFVMALYSGWARLQSASMPKHLARRQRQHV